MNALLKKTVALAALISACGAALAIRHENVAALKIEHKDGTAPLTVAVEAPAELVDLLTRWQKNNGQHQKWGDGFSLEWGDGLAAGDAARPYGSPGSDTLGPIGKHTYAKPGTYSLSASLYDFMPDDSHKVYWRGNATITVK
jgi:hypothetical protein